MIDFQMMKAGLDRTLNIPCRMDMIQLVRVVIDHLTDAYHTESMKLNQV